MKQYSTIVGMDVHKKMIMVAVLPSESDRVTERMTIQNETTVVEKLVGRLADQGPVEFVYEAGPCGYEVQRQIARMGHRCVVIAPALTPVRPGDRVKTDRRDAEKLARFYRAGELTEIRVPSREEEAARDLVRGREDILEDRLRARHRLMKFLLRQGCVFGETRAWSMAYQAWLKSQCFEWVPLQQTFETYVRTVEEAQIRLDMVDQQLQDLAQQEPYQIPVQYLRCLKGIDTLSALTLFVEAQDFRRFPTARGFMSYTGAVPSEHSTGGNHKRGSITKAGNAHIRRILGEAAWSYRRRSVISRPLAERRQGCPQEVVQIAKKAQDRLERKFSRMIARGKLHQVTVVAVARELAGFVWSIAQHCPVRATD